MANISEVVGVWKLIKNEKYEGTDENLIQFMNELNKLTSQFGYPTEFEVIDKLEGNFYADGRWSFDSNIRTIYEDERIFEIVKKYDLKRSKLQLTYDEYEPGVNFIVIDNVVSFVLSNENVLVDFEDNNNCYDINNRSIKKSKYFNEVEIPLQKYYIDDVQGKDRDLLKLHHVIMAPYNINKYETYAINNEIENVIDPSKWEWDFKIEQYFKDPFVFDETLEELLKINNTKEVLDKYDEEILKYIHEIEEREFRS